MADSINSQAVYSIREMYEGKVHVWVCGVFNLVISTLERCTRERFVCGCGVFNLVISTLEGCMYEGKVRVWVCLGF